MLPSFCYYGKEGTEKKKKKEIKTQERKQFFRKILGIGFLQNLWFKIWKKQRQKNALRYIALQQQKYRDAHEGRDFMY